MATIGSLLQVPDDVTKYEFLVEKHHTLTHDTLHIEMVYVLVGP